MTIPIINKKILWTNISQFIFAACKKTSDKETPIEDWWQYENPTRTLFCTICTFSRKEILLLAGEAVRDTADWIPLFRRNCKNIELLWKMNDHTNNGITGTNNYIDARWLRFFRRCLATPELLLELYILSRILSTRPFSFFIILYNECIA